MKELLSIQKELKANKDLYNKFGGFSYRSCESILESVKPLLAKHKCTLTLSDNITAINDRVYINAVATIANSEGVSAHVQAFAREAEEKKGMDESQLTGTASSYARKYALNGLFCIDDAKDADTDEFTKRADPDRKPKKAKAAPVKYKKQSTEKPKESPAKDNDNSNEEEEIF